uniref:Uncharacterized protein n=1 Tax=Utricularia reniformis TaxID=192314 RepID=A0A1Y0B2Z5_9LAMI|nr:hypothetical protein AEK19_MT1566 [Utricularia reniformis]ART31753.1 hypothetical protein AEK19_MT1566 [Utricularia reniformis]
MGSHWSNRRKGPRDHKRTAIKRLSLVLILPNLLSLWSSKNSPISLISRVPIPKSSISYSLFQSD